MLVEQGGTPDVAKVLDFGLVKEVETTSDIEVTHVDAITGTPQYLAPESIRAPDQVDERSDIYALGAVGYFLLTGEHVFTADTVVETCSMHLNDAPVAPSERLGAPVPADLEALLLACLAKESAERPANAHEVRRCLEACEAFGDWSEEDARAWWTRRGAELEALRERQTVTGRGLTVAIDVDDRG